MSERALMLGAAAWSMLGLVLGALWTLPAGSGLLLGMAVLGPLCAAGAAAALHHHRRRVGGLLLVGSLVTPTYFAWVLSFPALVVGVVLLLAPDRLVRR